MADTVRYLLEQMLPELEDFEKRGLFSKQEIKQIVKKRTDFEYRLKRRAILKEDYLHAIEYEVQLENLRVSRKDALVKKLKAANQRWRSSLSDRAITRRIIFLYERALRKLKGDIRLWLKYAEACRIRGSSRQFQKVVTRALQLHPTVPGLWMYSAAWELEANLNVEGARALMQRGLRMCNSSQQLWIEYFKMEMKAMQKLKARRLLLGLGPDAGKIAGNEDIITPSLASVPTQSDGDGEGGGQILADSPEDKLSLLLARQILKNAVSAIQSNLQFRMQFVEVLRGLEFKWRGMVEDEVYEEMKRDFGDMAECVDLHARRCMENEKAKDTNEVYKAAVEVYRSGLASAPSLQLYELCAVFLEEQLKAGGAADSHLQAAALEVEAIYCEAHSREQSTESMAERHVGLLLGQGRVKEAEELLQELCGMPRFMQSGVLWALRVGVVMSLGRVGPGGEKGWGGKERSGKLVREALAAVPMAQAARIWRLALEHWTRVRDGVQLASEAVVGAMAWGGKGEGGPQIACMAVKWTAGVGGIPAARTLYDRLVALPGPSIELVQACEDMEARAELEGDKDATSRTKKLKYLIERL